MKESLRKIIASLVIFTLIFFIIYNIVEVKDVTNEVNVIRKADKVICVSTLSVITSLCILEAIQIFMYICSPKIIRKKGKKLLKLAIITVIYILISLLLIYTFQIYSVPLVA